MIFPCKRCFPIQRKINLECFTLADMYLLPLLHCKFVVLCFSTLSFVNSDTTIFNRRSLFLRMFFNIQCITQKEKPSFQQTQTWEGCELCLLTLRWHSTKTIPCGRRESVWLLNCHHNSTDIKTSECPKVTGTH
jgi:hypothetical protein